MDAESKAKAIRELFAPVRSDYETVKGELDNLIRVRLDLRPALLLLGEKLTLTIEARSPQSPNPTVQVTENCYSKSPAIHTFQVSWRKNSSGDGYVGSWQWKPPRCGNYLLHWKCDIGGDIPEFWRNFAVIDNSYPVMILNSTSHASPRPEPDFHELHLPFSFWWEPQLFGRRPTAENLAGPSRWARAYGDDPGLLIFGGVVYLPENKTVFHDEPEAVQRTVLESFKELNAMFRFPRPVTSLLTYGIGNGPATVARSLGYDMIAALCADQNWQDGEFEINHWGAPARPYFVSHEDFRKTGDGGPNAMLGVQQCERQTMECRDYNCVYSFESGIAYMFDRYMSVTRPRIVNEVILSRELDFLRCFIESAGQGQTPLFLCCGVEMNGVWPEMAAINRKFMECLVKLAAETPIAYTTATAAADFYRRHYRQTPESVAYLHDAFVGMVASDKPPNYPDTMEIENAQFRSVFIKGRTLPLVYYDYSTAWNYRDWGNQDISRRHPGYVIPNTPDRYRVIPRILDTRPFNASCKMEDSPGKTVARIVIDAQQEHKNLALAVWDLPREYSRASGKFHLVGGKRFVPVKAPYTGNLCAIIVADVKKGRNEISLAVGTKPRPPKCLDLRLRGSVMAKVIERDGSATAYIYSTGKTAEELPLSPPAGVSCRLIPFDSDEPMIIDKATTIKVEPGKCQRIIGLTYEQMRSACPSAQPVGQDGIVDELLAGLGGNPR